VRDGSIKVVITLGEDLTKTGLTGGRSSRSSMRLWRSNPAEQDDDACDRSSYRPSAWVEKTRLDDQPPGRLQRLNHAVNAPGDARDDWEILRDLILASLAPMAFI